MTRWGGTECQDRLGVVDKSYPAEIERCKEILFGLKRDGKNANAYHSERIREERPRGRRRR